MKPFSGSLFANAAVLGILVLTPLPALATVISIEPSQTQLNVGDTFFVDLEANLASNEILSAFDIDLNFEDSAFSFVSASFIDPTTSVNQLDLFELGGFGFFGDGFDLGGGLLDVFGVSGNSDSVLEASQADTFVFARLEFLSVAEIANSVFALDLNDPRQTFLGANIADLSVSFSPSVATVSVGSPISVPEPSAIWLLLVGLATTLLSRRTRRTPLSA